MAVKTKDHILKAHDGLARDDAANAERLLAVADGNLRYAHAWGKFLVYRDGVWHIDVEDALTMEIAKGVAVEFKKGVPPYNPTDDYSLREHNWAKYTASTNGVRQMMTQARGVEGIVLDHEQLETNGYLFNCVNGTFDFSGVRDGEPLTFRKHDQADLLIMQSPVRYDSDAKCPTWDKCLETWQPDPDVRRYLQMRAGACALGLFTEFLDIDYGNGGNGKSKFHGAIQHVLGPYAIVPHKSLLMSRRGWSEHDTVYADLFRKRCAVATETQSGDSLNEESIKYLTGGDRIKGRRMREDPWEFWPTHTVILWTNFPPVIKGTDEGIWRRVHLVKWNTTIPADQVDDQLAEKLADEAPGILRWIMIGAMLYLQDGWIVPDVIQADTDKYREEEDVLGRFVRECVEVTKDEADSLYFDDLQKTADSWCDEAGVPTFSPKQLADVLEAIGAWKGQRVRVNRGYAGTVRTTEWFGLWLPDEEREQRSADGTYNLAEMAEAAARTRYE
jgi:putative DNA primase/helicase